jgi:ribonuclease HII
MQLHSRATEIVCGIDEAGRGPLAGPVTAAAVVLPVDFDTSCLGDSKALSQNKRESAAAVLFESASWGVGWAWPEEIDSINIHNASLLAMKRAYGNLEAPVDLVLVDGKFTPSIPVERRAIVKGDSSVPEIMAASIIAKVLRDRWMVRYSWIEPEYGFDRHKGYPTRAHRLVCTQIGLSPIHRKTFTIRPVPGSGVVL